jgi:hypothetical protein
MDCLREAVEEWVNRQQEEADYQARIATRHARMTGMTTCLVCQRRWPSHNGDGGPLHIFMICPPCRNTIQMEAVPGSR